MSIILEALRKASDNPVNKEIKGTQARELPETQGLHDVNDFKFSKSFVMMAVAVAVIGSVMFFSGVFKRDISKIGSAEGYSPPVSVSSTKELQKQDATPIGNLITKLSAPRLTLNGIVYGIGKPAAIIENKIIEEGGSVNGMKVVKIYEDKVEMVDQAGQPFTLKVN